MNPKKILKDAIKKHNLSTLKDLKNEEEVLALIRYACHIVYNEAPCNVTYNEVHTSKPKKYYSENVNGNNHDIVIWMNKFHPNGDLIDIHPVNSFLRVVVWRE